MTTNWALIASYIVAILIEIGLPLTLAIVAVKRFKVAWIVIITGVLTFIGSQVVHLPLLYGINALFTYNVLPMPSKAFLLWFNPVMAGLLAGLCEETARLVGFKVLKAKAKPYTSALALGIGHGGIESVIVGVIVLVSFLSGLFSSSALTTVSFWATPWHLPLAGGVERITAISSHLMMSILVWKAVTSHNYWWYGLAVLYHAVLDGVSVVLSQQGFSAWALEGIIGIFFVINVIVIWRFWVTEKARAHSAEQMTLEIPVE